MSRSCVLLGLLVLGCGATAPEPCIEVSVQLPLQLEDSVRANDIHGAQATVLIPGRLAWHGATGLNGSNDPMRPGLLIGTGSISKMYTAVAALRLIDRGVLALDDTVGQWFPGTPNVDPAITLERLLQQTSGIADYGAAPDFADSILADLQRVWTPEELLGFVGPPLFAPGAGWNASNTNSLLLGVIVAQESGRSLGDFMREELWPGRTHSWLAGDGPPPAEVATQWGSDGQGNLYDYSALYFGPALFSARHEVQASSADLADFARRLFDGDLLSPALRTAMLTIVPDDGRIAGQTGGGLGIRRYHMLGRTLYGHSGGTPNSSALVLFDPATGVVAAMSINQDGVSHGNSHFRTTPALLETALACAAP
jgi:D-alanyl-D-alanine carboxypeptidase